MRGFGGGSDSLPWEPRMRGAVRFPPAAQLGQQCGQELEWPWGGARGV